jgi:CHAD domain-containing protein
MSVELDASEAIGSGLGRMLDKLVDECVGFMRAPVSDEDVHETRKNIKKLRTLTRLARGVLGDRFRREDHALRDAGRLLSSARDAAVIVKTFASLGKHCRSFQSRRAFRRLRRRLVPDDAPAGNSASDVPAARVARRLRNFARRARHWPIDAVGPEAFWDALRRLYKAGRDAARSAWESPNDENLHDWRKRTKDLWHVALMLKNAWPGVMNALAAELKELSDLLGDDHDLAVLRVRLGAIENPPPEAEDVAVFCEVIDDRRAHLQRAAAGLGRRVYLEKPRDFVCRILGWWQIAGKQS